MRNRLIKGGIWALISRVLGIGLSLVLNILLARMLSPSDMGAYFLAVSLVSFFSILGQMGLSQAIIRLVAESMAVGMLNRAKQAILRAIILSISVGATIALLFYYGVGDFVAEQLLHSNGLHLIIGLIAIAILVNSVQALVAEIYRGFHDIRATSLVTGVLPQAVLVTLLALLWVGRGQVTLQLVFGLALVSSVITFFISAAFLRSRVLKLRGTGGVAYRELVGIAWPLCLIQIAIFAATQADLWVVGASLSEKDVAIYGAAQKLLILVTVTHGLVVAVTQSSVSELYAKGELLKLEKMIQGAALAACVPAGLLVLAFVFFGGDILTLIFGEFYRVGVVPLLVLSLGQFVSMLLGPADMIMMMTGFQKQLMSVILIGSLFRIILATVLASEIGLLGVAVGWSIGAIIQSYWIRVICISYVGVKTHVAFSVIKTFVNSVNHYVSTKKNT